MAERPGEHLLLSTFQRPVQPAPLTYFLPECCHRDSMAIKNAVKVTAAKPAAEKNRTPMTRTRKGAPDSEVKALLVKTAHQMIREESCSDLTARKLAERVGLKRQIVHYYFGTLDDLFVAVLDMMADESRARFHEALKADTPLRVTWQQTADASATLFEFIAMALHRDPIKQALGSYMDEFRLLQVNALEQYLDKNGIRLNSAAVVNTLVIASVSQTLAFERAMGVTMGHEQTQQMIESWLDAIESEAQQNSLTERL